MKRPIAVVIGSLASSLINFRLHLMLDLKAQGFDVVAVAPDDDKVANQLKLHGIQFTPISMARNGLNPVKDLLTLWQLYRCLKKLAPTLLFTYTIKPVIYGGIAGWLISIKQRYAMLTGTGYVFTNESFKDILVGTIAKNMFRFSLKRYHKLFFQNPDNLAFFREQKIVMSNQATALVNGSGVDTDHFQPMPLPKHFAFIMIARLLKDKGVLEYVGAAREVKKQYPEISFKLVGWIDTNPNAIDKNALKEWIKDGTIEFLGKLDDVRESIAGATVYVLPSYGEGTPRTVLEAMAMARPIITTDVPGCRQTVVPKKNGLLVPVKDQESLAEAMMYFVKHPEETVRMGLASRKIAELKYDVQKVNHHMLSEMEVYATNTHLSTVES